MAGLPSRVVIRYGEPAPLWEKPLMRKLVVHSEEVDTEEVTAPWQQLPDGALTPEQARALEQRSPVDGAAGLAWLLGEGPDPWLDGSGGGRIV